MIRLALALPLLLAGCVSQADYPPPPERKTYAPHLLSEGEGAIVRETVARPMKDPGSVQFRDIAAARASDGRVWVCGEANARNSYGGYAGFTAFYGYLADGSFMPVTFADEPGAQPAVVNACAAMGIRIG